MRRLALVLLLSVSGCAVMHTVTGDPMFKPEPPPAIRGPVVPEPEPEDAQYQADKEEAELPPLPPKPSEKKKKSGNVAMKR